MFGSLAVRTDRVELGPTSFGGVKPKSVLELLLLGRGRLVSKDLLIESVWTDDLPRDPTATLQSYVSVLRRQLAAAGVDARRIIATAPGAYRLALDDVDLDIIEFDHLLDRAERAGPERRRALREQAVALATGDLLEDAPYAEWVQEERDRYRQRVVRTHVLVGEDALADGDLSVALRHGDAAIGLIPSVEEAHRLVILAHHGLGHGELSRRAYTRCVDTLRSELDVEPSADTELLAERVATGTPMSELVTPSARPHAATGRRRVDRRHHGGRLPFVGRRTELARIADHVTAAHAGRFTLVTVEALTGFGRTTLLDHVRETTPGPVGWAAYSPRELDLPRLPLAAGLVDALRGSAGAVDAARYAHTPVVTDLEPTMWSLHEILRRHTPMVLLLDDAHWADDDTVSALGWLHRHAPTLPLAVVATLRTQVHERRLHPVRTDDHRLRAIATDHVVLGPLTGPKNGTLRSSITEVAHATGGIPVLMSDLWRWRHAGNRGLPTTVEETVRRRVRGLGGRLASILQAAAVAPDPIQASAVAEATELSGESEIRAELERLSDLHFLERVPGGFRFVAPLVQDVLARTVPPRRPVVSATGGRDLEVG